MKKKSKGRSPRAVGGSRQRLVRPHSSNRSEQCREMGIAPGDIIEGRETYGDGTWSEARLQLLWLGKEVAVWKEWRRNSWMPGMKRWQPKGEDANWTLNARQWFKRSKQSR